jgi:hypothetical protein
VIVQDPSQIERCPENGWETFIANAGAITAFGNAELKTLGYLRGKLSNVPMLLNRSSGASSSALLSGARQLQRSSRGGAARE